VRQNDQESAAEQTREHFEVARNQRREEEDAPAFSTPISQRFQQLRNIEQLTGALSLVGRPIYRLGGCCLSDPRFRPEEAEEFAAHIRQEHARYAARMQAEAERRRVNNERWRIYTEQQEKEKQARIAAQAKQASRMFLKRRIVATMIALLLLLVLIESIRLLSLSLYNFVH
jgi:hypothetical protein